jgi:methylated-DNA-protein-cysteine methyltransferase-like protein
VQKEQGNTTEFNSNYVRIWQTVKLIPRGKVASYGQIADLSGLPKRARLVGKALAMLPKNGCYAEQVPWHRVVNSQGKISFPQASDCFQRQKAQLQQEQVVVVGNKIKFSIYQWQPDLAELLFVLPY